MRKIILILSLICTSLLFAQKVKITITGKITSKEGKSIPGVTIISDSKANTTSDLEGNYSIEVKNKKAILIFTYLGFATQTIVVGNASEINVTLLETTTDLDEVVVVGYGTQKRSSVTGSISKYKNERMDEAPVTRLDQALQGKLAGVSVQNISSEAGADAKVTIRGISSINASSNPLVVVDGQPVPDGLAYVNMADVESVEVLKDAASAAIYGSRGASGVILITTKSGKSEKTKYALKYSMGFKTPYKFYSKLSSSDYLRQLYGEAALRATDPYVIANPGQFPTISDSDKSAYVIEQDLLGGYGTDYQKEALRTGLFKTIQLTASGGTKDVRYFISGGYQMDEGMMIKSNSEKYNLRTKIDIDLSKKIKLSVNLNPSMSVKQSPSENFTNFARFRSYLPVYHNAATADLIHTNPSLQWSGIMPGDFANPRHFSNLMYSGYMPDGVFWTSAAITGPQQNTTQNNPIASTLNQDIDAKEYRMQNSADLTINVLPGLDFKTTGSVYMKYSTSLNWANRNASGDGITNKGVYKSGTFIDLLNENTLNYKLNINDHSITTLLGFTAQKTKTTSQQITGLNYPNDDIRTLNNALQYDAGGTYGVENQIGLLSYLGRVNYGYKSKYNLTASFRADGSSYFGPGKKWGTFPSISGGWVVSKEKFLNKVDWLTKLNFRASYGVSGNNRISDFGFLPLLTPANYSLGQGNGTLVTGQAPTASIFANKDITWESTFQTNFGVDVSLLNNRINLSVDYYNSETDKLLLQQSTMAFSGLPLRWNNLGSLNNKGYEFELSTTNIKTKNFKWLTSANLSHTENKILELGQEAYLRNQGERTEIYQNIVGSPLVQFYGFKTDGVWLSQADIDASGLTSALPNVFVPGGLKLVDINHDGKIDNYDRTVIGSPYPDFTWGLTNNFTYKSFDLSFTFQGVQGGSIINGDANYVENKKENLSYNQNHWISPLFPGDGKTPYEGNGFNWMLTDYVVEDASYFSLREVNLGYRLPQPVATFLKIKSLRVYYSAQNLYYHYAKGYRGVNPEGRSNSGEYGSSLLDGYQRGGFPIPRTLIFGVDINF